MAGWLRGKPVTFVNWAFELLEKDHTTRRALKRLEDRCLRDEEGKQREMEVAAQRLEERQKTNIFALCCLKANASSNHCFMDKLNRQILVLENLI